MQKAHHRIYFFDSFTLDLASGCLLREGREITLRAKSFQMLCYLVENGGRLIGKEELMETLWPDSFVTDDSLVKCLKDVRRALGDNAQQFVKTVPRRGYIFVAKVSDEVKENSGLLYSEQADDRSAAFERERGEAGGRALKTGVFPLMRQLTTSSRALVAVILLIALAAGLSYVWISHRSNQPTVARAVNSIAVLPFKPLSADSQDESLEMGMAETLITKLCSIRQIVVRPMGAVRKFTDPRQDPVRAGQELDVETVLAGSIQKAGERVRVTVQLMNVRTGESLWAAQFDADFRDIFQVQDSISERVAHALTLRLSGEESARLAGHYTENPEAYQLYLQGQYLLGKQTGDRSDNLRRSLEFYRLAVDRDPKFARAYVGIAEFYISAGDPKLAPRDSSLHARSAVVRALELDDTLAEAHNALAELKYQYEFDWSGAEAEFKRAIDLEPNVAYFHIAYSWNQMCQGRFNQAQAELARAVELEPGSLRFNKTQGVLFIFMRRYDEAISHYEKMREVEPTLIHRNQFSMAVAYAQAGMRAEAVEELLEDGRTRGYLMTNEIELLREAFRASGWEAYMRMTINLLEEKAKREHISPTILAGLYALSGGKEPALAWLEKAIDIGDPWISLIKIQPAYDSLRSDPQFRELLFRVGLQ